MTASIGSAAPAMKRVGAAEDNMAMKDWVDGENFDPGYLTRGLHLMPKQGDHDPWVFTQDYWREKDQFPAADLDDGW